MIFVVVVVVIVGHMDLKICHKKGAFLKTGFVKSKNSEMKNIFTKTFGR